MKIKLNSNDDLPLKKMLELRNIVVAFRHVFHKYNKYQLQGFLDECLHKLQMLEYNRIDVSEGIDVNKTSVSEECNTCDIFR